MCGINGIYALNKDLLAGQLQKQLREMNAGIIHRGPDDEGFYIEDQQEYFAGLGHRRLSIIDLRTGKQPIYSADRQKIIVYNGEVYNYRELKKKHFSVDDQFYTETDTEVILKLYEKYGTDSFSMLEGMFAFSIYDRTKQKIFIARDFFGEKPLYYTQSGNTFYWASELKSIVRVLPQKPAISLRGMNLFFRLTYIPAPYTIYESVHKLSANHFIEIDCVTGKHGIREIAEDKIISNETFSFEEAVKHTFELVNQSVESRIVSDVPIGTFLSGGVDSSVVSLCVAQQSSARIDTFSIGFLKKEFDETEKSRVVAKLINSNHHEFVIGEKDLAENIDRVLLNFDEPFADSSSLPTYFVANKTSEFVKVALTGDGGDEVFGGYNKYYMGKLNRKYTSVVPGPLHRGISKILLPVLASKEDKRGLRFKLSRLLKGIDYGDDFYYNIISLGFMESEMKKVFRSPVYEEDPVKYYKDIIGDKKYTVHDFRNIDRYLSLEGDMAVKVDRSAMLSSLESRAPFLNKKIWDFTHQLPENFLIKGTNKKYILKKAFENYFPAGFLDKSKKGFGVPVGDWLRDGLKNELESYINPGFLSHQGIFNEENIIPLVKDHVNGKVDNTFRIWTYYCFQKWYKEIYD